MNFHYEEYNRYDDAELREKMALEYRRLRTPTVGLMRDEMKKERDLTKYTYWNIDNCTKVATASSVIEQIRTFLWDRIPLHGEIRINAHQAIAMLDLYLKQITDRLREETLDIQPVADNPANNVIISRQVEIKKIIDEYDIMHRTANTEYRTRNLERFRLKEGVVAFLKGDIKKLKELQEKMKRKERIIALGSCIPLCSWEKNLARKEMENAPLEKQLDALNREIVEIDSECMEAAADATQFVDVISSNFLSNLSRFIHKIFHDSLEIPADYLDAAAQDVATHLRRIFKKKRFEWVDMNKQINLLYQFIKEEKSRLNSIVKEIENAEKEKTKLIMEQKNYKIDIGNLIWMLDDARKMLNYSEQGYASTYQELNRLKKKTIEMEAELGISPRGPPEISPVQPSRTPSPIITSPQSDEMSSPHEQAMGPPLQASSPVSTSNYSQQERSGSPVYRSSSPHQERSESPTILSTPPQPEREETPYPRGRPSEMQQQDIPDDSPEDAASVSDYFKFLDEELPPSAMMNVSDLSGGGSSHAQSLERSANSSFKKTISIPSPGKRDGLQIDVEVIPQNIRRSPSGQRVVCDVAVEMQEAAAFRRPLRRIEQRNVVVRGTPPISQTVGRRFDRKYGMFTPQSAFKRRHVRQRSPLFEGDYESPPSPWGTGRKTHPELMDITPHVPSPPRQKLDTTMEWEINPLSNY